MKKFILILGAMVLMAGTAWAGPVSRNVDKTGLSEYRVYSAPVNYKTPAGKFAKIDTAHAQIIDNKIYRNRAVVKSWFDGKTVTFTPDHGAWSLDVAVKSIKTQIGEAPGLLPINLSATAPQVHPTDKNRTLMCGGGFEINTTARGSRFLIPATDAIKNFEIEFTLTPSKDLTLIQADGRVWFEANGRVVLTLTEPKLLDTELNVIGNTMATQLDLVDFTLVDNLDGTWTYTKVPGQDFAGAKLQKDYLIDADVVYVTTGSGGLYLYHATDPWATLRGAVSGTGRDITGTAYVGVWDGNVISRGQAVFNCESLEGTVTAGTIHYKVGSVKNVPETILQKSTAALPLGFPDFSAFIGGIGGPAISGAITNAYDSWSTGAFTDMAYLQEAMGGTLRVGIVEKPHDYDNVDPGAGDYWIALLFDWPDYEMYIALTITPPPSTRNPWHGFSDWKNKGFSIW